MNFNLLQYVHSGRSNTLQTNFVDANAYVQYTNFDVHSLDSSVKPTLRILPDIDDYHKNKDIVFLDGMTDLTSPSKPYIEYIKTFAHISESQAKYESEAVIMFFNGVQCGDRISYTPRYKGGQYSPYQRDRVTSNSAYRLAHRLSKLQELVSNESVYNIGIDLTFPDNISEIALSDPEKAIKLAVKSVRSFTKKLSKDKRWIRRPGQKLFYFFNVHTFHSHKPGDPDPTHTPTKPHLHVHLNLINLICNQDLSLIRFNPNISTKILKDTWSYAIFKSGFMVPDPVLFIHYSAVANKGKLTHRIRYCGRSPLNDCFSYFNDFDFIESDHPQTFNEHLVNYKNPRHTCGALRLLSALLPEEDIDEEELCPICSSKSVYLGKFDPGTIRMYVREQNLAIVRWSSRLRQYQVIERIPGDFMFDDIPISELNEMRFS